MHSPSSRRKYLVEVHAYADHLYPVDFYTRVHDVNRYRLRTNQYAAGKPGGTVLAIMAEILRHDPLVCFGLLTAVHLFPNGQKLVELKPVSIPAYTYSF
jgi:hypothetical protein